MNWSYYDFWDLDKNLGIFDFYILKIKKYLFSFNIADYYKFDHFVIVHIKTNESEINYDSLNDISFNNMIFNAIQNTSKIGYYELQNSLEANFTCITFKRQEKSITLTTDFFKCFDTKNNFYNYHFNNFCQHLNN